MRRTIACAPTHSPQGSWAYCTPNGAVWQRFCACFVVETQQTLAARNKRPLPQRSTPALAAPHSTIGSTRPQLPRQRPAHAVAAAQRQAQLRAAPLPRRTATTGFKKMLDKKRAPHNGAPFARRHIQMLCRGLAKHIPPPRAQAALAGAKGCAFNTAPARRAGAS